MNAAYPLTITVGLQTFGKKIRVLDANGRLVTYAHQKAARLRLIQPSYLFDDASGTTLLRLRVMPSVGEGRFLLERESFLSERLERLAVPAALIVTLIERGHI